MPELTSTVPTTPEQLYGNIQMILDIIRMILSNSNKNILKYFYQNYEQDNSDVDILDNGSSEDQT